MRSREESVEIADLWSDGWRALRGLETPAGFTASDRATGRYWALFGRDSIWILLFLLEAADRRGDPGFMSWVEERGNRIFASLSAHQGTSVDDFIEEEPGKIIHEFHEGADAELASIGLPLRNGRSYSGFDQTFLFVTAFRRFAQLFPASQSVKGIWPAVVRAIEWIEGYADEDEDGLYEHRRRNPANHVNQVWKDSFDAATHLGFDIPPQPLAWIDVQGYAYRALLDASSLCEERDMPQRARDLSQRAASLRDQVDERFWMTEENCLAMAVDGVGGQVQIVSSNPVHALWAGLVKPDRVPLLIERLSQPDMLTPYGLRTLSSASDFFAPFAYHRGNVWPFDNAIFAAGLLTAGFEPEAKSLMEGVTRALAMIGSPIELFVVLDDGVLVSEDFSGPLLAKRRPSPENQIQGWTAAAMLFFAAALSGLDEPRPVDG
jgi:glycogen debranching enzyme